MGTGGREDRRVRPAPSGRSDAFHRPKSHSRPGSTTLEAFTPDEVNSWSGKDLDIDLFRPLNEDNASTSIWAPRTLAFTSETFLLSFSLPNFHFHAVTAYDILRTRGVPLGKRDYEGRLRTRAA